MFSERLEKLIQSCLQDGILTDQEKTAIIKRAKAEGEDIDEIEIYIDSLLQKRQKELNNNSASNKKVSFSGKEELKRLIEIAMTDGIITSKERTVIFNKAAALGIDTAEVEIYLDAEIQRAEQAADAAKRDKIGKVCPQCGKQVPPLTLKCECGYEFTNQKQVSSVQIFAEKIEKIQNQKISGSDELLDFDYTKAFKEQQNKIISVIQLFPVPNTKEDIIEFLALSIPNAKMKKGFANSRLGRALPNTILGILLIPIVWGLILLINTWGKIEKDPVVAHNRMAEVWRAKCEQVLIKGRSLRGDPEFTQQLDYYENMLNKE